jgi:hypothetical protein
VAVPPFVTFQIHWVYSFPHVTALVRSLFPHSVCLCPWGERANPLLPHELDALDRWTQSVLDNVARRVPNPGAPVDYVVVTDASAWGWGALVYDASSGCFRAHQHEWDDAFTGRAQSTRA